MQVSKTQGSEDEIQFDMICLISKEQDCFNGSMAMFETKLFLSIVDYIRPYFASLIFLSGKLFSLQRV